MRLRGYNLGSGQRPFFSTPEIEWINVDAQARWNPDWVGDAAHTPYPDGSADYVVLHHCYEHAGLGEADDMIRESHRLLKPGGSLIVTVPDIRELAKGFLAGRLDTITYAITLYGAFMGDEADRHKFGYDRDLLIENLSKPCSWSKVAGFDWRPIPSASVAQDWWILGVECVK